MGQDEGVTSSHEDARAEVAAVLASTSFSRSPRLASLFIYLCNKYFEGQSETVKEYNIAVDVLRRPPSFDPNEDAIARVEVHRLRKRLRDYYLNEGAGRRLRIGIPPGSYVPTFVSLEEAPALVPGSDAVPEPPPAIAAPDPTPLEAESFQPSRRSSTTMVLGGGAVAVLLLILWLHPWNRDSKELRTASGVGLLAAGTPAAPGTDEVRILCGQRRSHVDRLGKTWLADRYFTGGTYFERPRQFLDRTYDPAIVQSARIGEFQYDIPLRPGTYEMRLYFAETSYGPDTITGGGENSRVFHVEANGRRILDQFDIIADAGGANIADVRAFKDVTPAQDGSLHLRFVNFREQPMVSAIEIVPASEHLMNPIRIHVQDTTYTDSSGHLWMPDNYWSGGQIAIHRAAISGTADRDLFAKERYGNFSYAIPVPDGVYEAALYFAETYWGPENVGGAGTGAGSRVFDILCNREALARNLDIYAQAGANRALVMRFPNLRPNRQGKLQFSFVPTTNYALVNAIEVIDRSE